MAYLRNSIFMFIVLNKFLSIVSTQNVSTYSLKYGEVFYSSHGYSDAQKFKVYCYEVEEKSLFSIWKSVKLEISLKDWNYRYYVGSCSENVQEKWSSDQFDIGLRQNFDPFEHTCVGILAEDSYTISFELNEIDYKLFSFSLVGFVLFSCAHLLAPNHYLHYICGVLFGIVLTVMILLYIIYKIVKNKLIFYGSVVASWFIGYYWYLDVIFAVTELLFTTYKKYILICAAISGVISFLLCYRFGPITDWRTVNIIRWSIKATGLLLIYSSSYLNDVTFGIAILMCCYSTLRLVM